MNGIDLAQEGWQRLEWLQTNRSGAFAMGCVDRIPRRKYHSHLTVRDAATGEAVNILGEVGEVVTVGSDTYLLHNFDFGNGVYPHGFQHVVSFAHDPLPSWRYKIGNLRIERTLELGIEQDIVRVVYSVVGVTQPVTLALEPMILCRSIHRLIQENAFLNGSTRSEEGAVWLEPYAEAPRIYMKVTGQAAVFHEAGRWDRSVHYECEKERGYEWIEDLYCPGSFMVELKNDGTFTFLLGTGPIRDVTQPLNQSLGPKATLLERLRAEGDRFRISKPRGLESLIAGYPWFGERSRDTLLALPGLCLATNQTSSALAILEEYGETFMRGDFPDRPASVEQVQNGTVDVPLLYIRAVQAVAKHAGKKTIKPFMPVVYHLLNLLKNSPDDRVQVTSDCGLCIRPNAVPMSWMNAIVNGQALTPRHGFAIEQNALLYNDVRFALEWAQENHHTDFTKTWKPLVEEAETAFMGRFWSREHGYLADAFDGSAQDLSMRPNQLWAVGLPFSPVPTAAAREVIEKVREQLVTPVGLRSLAPSDPRYESSCRGGAVERDLAMHQGSVWPWLIGIYADSIAKVYGIDRARAELNPIVSRLLDHLNNEGCLGQVSELFDGDQPHRAAGAPSFACSIAELLRVVAMIAQDR